MGWVDFTTGITAAAQNNLVGNIGNIDGGVLGDSVDLLVPATIRDAYDAMTGAMSALFINLDGGTL